MDDRRSPGRIVAVTIALATGVLALLMSAGVADASPIPGIPFTTASLCTSGGGTVTTVAPGVQRCQGGGDTGDLVVGDDQASLLGRTVPRPPVGSPSLP